MSKKRKIQIRNNTVEFLVFTTQAGEEGIEVRIEDETVWLTQKLMGVLFDKGRSTITEHLQNIFESCELEENSVCRNFRHTAEDGKDMLGPAHRALMEQFPVDQDVLAAVAGLAREFMSQSDTIEHILDPLSRNEMKALLERVAAGAGKQENKEPEFNCRYAAFKEKYSRRSGMMRRIAKL